MRSRSDHPLPGRRPLAGSTVLIVEDVWLIADGMQSVLETAGARVLGPCFTLADAEAALAAELPDVGVFDLRLGAETTHDLIDRMRRLRVPVVISTACRAAAEAGPVAAVLTKPVRAADLVAAVLAAAPLRQSALAHR